MSTNQKADNLGIVVWFNLLIGIYNIYVFQQDSAVFNLTIGTFNIGVWAFLRNKTLRLAYIKSRLTK